MTSHKNQISPFAISKKSNSTIDLLSLGVYQRYTKPPNLEISPEFPNFPDFQLRSPERYQGPEYRGFLHGKSGNLFAERHGS